MTLSTAQTIKIVAASGSGKSSLLSFLSGLRADYSGDILYDDKNVRQFSAIQWSRLRSQTISMVYQDLRLFKNLSARQNIEVSQAISSAVDKPESIEDMAGKLNVLNQLDRETRKLSFGQMQRVAIIRAISRNFKWLILDEPFSHLDRDNASIAWNLICEQAQLRNAGIIIACLDEYDFINAEKIFHL